MLEIQKGKRRFIAGATCPACKQMDKVVMYSDDDGAHFECVSCGHTESLNNETLAQQVKHAPLDGLDAGAQSGTKDEDEAVSLVKFVDPDAK